ncbi:MAG: hypothetical protein DI533_11840 [Cereibacter sphaeroides]|uniref:Uncharacterized protein n=1 Tax=Cereibacter sphaeroides TaxID=1063 RepID=A0A2W5S4A8_CERSP|nr:MAG: hypothetical protein DI533_11840 [Cereibacter sphaeroides]
MRQAKLEGGRIKSGIWEGLVSGGQDAPALEMRHQNRVLPDLSVTQRPDGWSVHVPIPASALSEGVQTFLLAEAGSDRILGHFTIIAGVVMEEDMRAELDLLRAELDMLKRAFRRHCLETAPDPKRF